MMGIKVTGYAIYQLTIIQINSYFTPLDLLIFLFFYFYLIYKSIVLYK